jgi:hypothetical protein
LEYMNILSNYSVQIENLLTNMKVQSWDKSKKTFREKHSNNSRAICSVRPPNPNPNARAGILSVRIGLWPLFNIYVKTWPVLFFLPQANGRACGTFGSTHSFDG